MQWGAPHSTQPPGQQNARYGHCWQGADVMCYAEDSGAAQQLRVDCGTIEGAIIESYDCGRDDYFNPAPPPGSYLATHWNVYDSAFLAPCAEVVPACGGGGTATATPRPPAATSGPAIEGTSRRGAALRATPGNWINSPHRYAYQWQRQSGRTWRNVSEGDQSALRRGHARPRPPPARDRHRDQRRRRHGRHVGRRPRPSAPSPSSARPARAAQPVRTE